PPRFRRDNQAPRPAPPITDGCPARHDFATPPAQSTVAGNSFCFRFLSCRPLVPSLPQSLATFSLFSPLRLRIFFIFCFKYQRVALLIERFQDWLQLT